MIPDALKDYGRIVLALVLVIASLSVIFGVATFGLTAEQPAAGDQAGQDSGMTTLRFGLQLEGGTRIQAPLQGVTAENISVGTAGETTQIEENIATDLGVNVTEVNIIQEQERLDRQTGQQSNQVTITHLEVRDGSVTEDELRSALQNQGISSDSVRSGVTEQTREQMVSVINDKINQAGLSGGTARTVRRADGSYLILVEVPGESRQDVIKILEDEGSVQVDIYHPSNGTSEYKTIPAVIEKGDFQQVGSAQQDAQYGPHIPVTLTPTAAQDFRQATEQSGMAPGGSRCFYEQTPNDTGPCLLTKVDGEVVYAAGMSPGLANNIASGAWESNPTFILQTRNISEAQELELHLQAGELPTAIAFDQGSVITVTPTQGEEFKTGSLLIGIIALIAVAGKVFLRYKDPKIVLPMVLVSISEVIILGGFAAIVGYPIDLSVVGGFIAVIGTGVDDLIIVANEILTKGDDINSSRVFRSRFKKAFWVIGAAALTTITALFPLIAFRLGQLGGFAIFTIVGILIGVFITRPAYGDYLNHILIDE